MKKSTIFLSIIGLGLIGLFGYRMVGGGNEQRERPTPQVIGLQVYTQPISDQVEALATAQANESINITANTTETIQEILFTDGQYVEEGDVIVLLAQNEEQAQLEAAKAQLNEHERELKRLKTLLKNKAASKREHDERITLVEISKNLIQEIQARIDNRTLKAPFEGALGIRRLSVGALVQPGDLITTLDQIDPIKLDFSVPEIYLSHLRTGLPIRAVSDARPDHIFTGEVESINSRVDPVTRSILIRAVVDNDDGLLKPGMLLKVTLLEDSRDAVVVPEESIIQRQSSHYLSVVKDGNTIEEREVKIGVRRPGLVEITEGLKAGEIIVVRGMGNVKTGQTVTVQEVWDTIKDEQYSAEPSTNQTEDR